MDANQVTEALLKCGVPFVPVYVSVPFKTEYPDTLRLLKVFSRSALVPDNKIFIMRRSEMKGDSLERVETILAFDPFDSISSTEGNPFELLTARLEKYKLPTEIKTESFFGGALGYFSYDSVRYIEPVLSRSPGNLARLDKNSTHCDAELMFFKKRIVIDYRKKQVLFATGIFPAENDSRELLLQKAAAEIIEMQKLYEKSQSFDVTPPPELHDDREILMDEMEAMLGKENFLAGVKKLKNHIREGDIFQAVLSDQMSVPFPIDPLDLFTRLVTISPSPYEFYFSTGKRVLLGSSPEMLLKVDGNKLETHPIAGTRPVGNNPDEKAKFKAQLLSSVKEKAEHLMLVDLARNDIGRTSEAGKVNVDSFMKLKQFGSVIHLVSKVVGVIKPHMNSIQALAACFPAGTLSGAPKVRAMQILSEIEELPRGFYGGAIVAASLNGDLDSCIAIRSVRIEDGRAIVQAGAGIVADSKAENEYAEITHKTKMVRRALAQVLRPS